MSVSEKQQDIPSKKWTGLHSNLSVNSLIISNLLIIGWAIIEKWSIFTVMWVYWAQSVSIGIFWFIKMLTLKRFSTKDFQRGTATVKSNVGVKIHASLLFLFPYGFSHFCYALFLVGAGKSVEPVPIILAGSIFFVNCLFSFFHNREWDTRQRQNLTKLMFFPYARVITMHITVMVACSLRDKGLNLDGSITLVVFLLLKTMADVALYIQQLKGFSDWPSSKLDDAGPLVQLLSGKTQARKFARKIHDQMKKAYVGKHEYQAVNADDFPNLNLKYYTRTAKKLKSKGFTVLGDIEDLTLSRVHPQFRTFIRYLADKDGTIGAGIFYICNKECPKFLHLTNSALSTKVIDLQTEFSNGCFLLTTNTTETLSTTPRILVEYLTSDMGVVELLETHKKRVEEHLAKNSKIHAIPIHSLEEVIDSANRQNMIFSAYGKSIPGILLEINKIAESAFGGSAVESIVYEMRKLRDSE